MLIQGGRRRFAKGSHNHTLANLPPTPLCAPLDQYHVVQIGLHEEVALHLIR
jgi:hypothetical protein